MKCICDDNNLEMYDLGNKNKLYLCLNCERVIFDFKDQEEILIYRPDEKRKRNGQTK